MIAASAATSTGMTMRYIMDIFGLMVIHITSEKTNISGQRIAMRIII